NLRGRSESRQRLAVMPPVVLDVGLNQPYEGVNRRLDRAASGRQIVLQGPGRPGPMCFGEHDDSEAAGCHMPEDIGTRTEISSRAVLPPPLAGLVRELRRDSPKRRRREGGLDPPLKPGPEGPGLHFATCSLRVSPQQKI